MFWPIHVAASANTRCVTRHQHSLFWCWKCTLASSNWTPAILHLDYKRVVWNNWRQIQRTRETSNHSLSYVYFEPFIKISNDRKLCTCADPSVVREEQKNAQNGLCIFFRLRNCSRFLVRELFLKFSNAETYSNGPSD